MKVEELKELMNNIIDMLRMNKEAMTPEVMVMISKVIRMIRENPTYLQIAATALSSDVESVTQMLNAGDKAMEMEQKLVMTDMTDKLISVLTNIQDRTLVMAIIAGLI